MAIIKMDLNGLADDEQALRNKIEQMSDLIGRTEQLVQRVSESWIGQSGTSFVSLMLERQKKAEEMVKILKEFLSYLQKTQNVFSETDRVEAAEIRKSF